MRLTTLLCMCLLLAGGVLPAWAAGEAADSATACEACAENPTGLCADCCIAGMVEMMPCLVCGSSEMCEHKAELVGRVHDEYDALEIDQITLPALPVAYIETTLSGDVAGTMAMLVEEAAAQELIAPETLVCTVMPDAMAAGYTLESPLYCSVTIPAEAVAGEPLASFTIPGGEYLIANYYGPYEGLDAAWLAAFVYAQQLGIELDYAGVCFESYVDDPTTTPAEEVLTQIYIPLAGTALMDNPAAVVPESL